MRRKNIFVLFSILIVLAINYALIVKKPVTEFINVKDYLLGIDIISVTIILSIIEKVVIKVIKKLTHKSSLSYEPKALWIISLSLILSGLSIICLYLIEKYVPVYKLNYFYVNLVFQLFITLIVLAFIYELYNLSSSFSLRISLLFIKLADKLFDMNKVELALGIYERLSKKTAVIKNPLVYAKIKIGISKCYYELSKKSSKKSCLQKAIKQLEDIAKIRELGKRLGIVKTNLGDLYYEYYDVDSKTNHLTTALSLYESAMDYFSREENVVIYTEVLNKVNNVKTRLSAQNFS